MNLDKKSVRALSLLYKSSHGLPYNELGIDDQTFLFLYDNGYISEPEVIVLGRTEAEPICFHSGLVRIEALGRAYIEKQRATDASDQWEMWFKITTIILASLTLLATVFRS